MYFRVSTMAGLPDGRGPRATCLRRCSQALALSKVTLGAVWDWVAGASRVTPVGAMLLTLVGATLLACVGAILLSLVGATELTLFRAIALSFASIAFAALMQPIASVENAPTSNALRTGRDRFRTDKCCDRTNK